MSMSSEKRESKTNERERVRETVYEREGERETLRAGLPDVGLKSSPIISKSWPKCRHSSCFI